LIRLPRPSAAASGQKPKCLIPPEFQSVVALGDRLVVHVNGQRTAEIRDDRGRKQGRSALQLPGGQDMDVWVK
jgi:hypothetical protein